MSMSSGIRISVVILCFVGLTVRLGHCDETAVITAHEAAAVAISERDYTKAGARAKELAIAAGMPDEVGQYALDGFESIAAENDDSYIDAVERIIRYRDVQACDKAKLLDLLINAPLGEERYALVREAAALVYAETSLINCESVAMISLADYVASQNLGDSEGAVNAVRQLLRTPEGELRVLAANNIAYAAVHFSSISTKPSDAKLGDIVALLKSDEQIMSSQAGPVVMYGGIMSKLQMHTIEGVAEDMNELYAMHKARNKLVEKDILYYIGHYTEQLMQSGHVRVESTQIIFPCYQQLIEVYPDCNEARYASWRLFENALAEDDAGGTIVYGEFLLSRLSVDEQPVLVLFPLAEAYFSAELYENAVANYQKFLLKALSTDHRREIAIQRLQTIETINPSLSIVSDELLQNIIGGCPRPGPKAVTLAGCKASQSGSGCGSPCPENSCDMLAECDCSEYNWVCHSDATCTQNKPYCDTFYSACDSFCYAAGSCSCNEVASTCGTFSPIRNCGGSKIKARCIN